MFYKKMVIWSDPLFLKEDGSPEEGAEIHTEYFRVHPHNAKKVKEGLQQMIGLDIKIVTEKPEIYNVKNT